MPPRNEITTNTSLPAAAAGAENANRVVTCCAPSAATSAAPPCSMRRRVNPRRHGSVPPLECPQSQPACAPAGRWSWRGAFSGMS
jgi:hypothetical protein